MDKDYNFGDVLLCRWPDGEKSPCLFIRDNDFDDNTALVVFAHASGVSIIPYIALELIGRPTVLPNQRI